MNLTQEEKLKFVEIIKNIDLQVQVIKDPEHLKWYKFGAYDALRTLTYTIMDENNVPKTKKTSKKD